MSEQRCVEPVEVAREVEDYLDTQAREVAQASNRELLDESGVYVLHSLAAKIYAIGFNDGQLVGAERARGQRRRDRDKAAALAAIDALGKEEG